MKRKEYAPGERAEKGSPSHPAILMGSFRCAPGERGGKRKTPRRPLSPVGCDIFSKKQTKSGFSLDRSRFLLYDIGECSARESGASFFLFDFARIRFARQNATEGIGF